MTTLSLPPIEAMDAAAKRLIDATDNARRRTAINKAIYRLHQPIAIVATCGGFLVPSFGETGGVVYRVDTVSGCGCKAGASGQPCKHAEIVAILEEAGRYTMPALARVVTFEQAQAEIDELYS